MDIRGFFAKKAGTVRSAIAHTLGTPPYPVAAAVPRAIVFLVLHQAPTSSGKDDKRKADDDATATKKMATEPTKPTRVEMDATSFFSSAPKAKPVPVDIAPDDFFKMGSTSKKAAAEIPAPQVVPPKAAEAATQSPGIAVKPEAKTSHVAEHAARSSHATPAVAEAPRAQASKRTREEEVVKDEPSGSQTSATSKAVASSNKRPTPPAARASLNSAASPPPDDSGSPAPPPPRKWYPGMKDTAPPNKGAKRIPVRYQRRNPRHAPPRRALSGPSPPRSSRLLAARGRADVSPAACEAGGGRQLPQGQDVRDHGYARLAGA